MNKPLNLLQIAEKIQRLSPETGGVFSYADLSNIVASGSAVKNSRVISRLIKGEIILKVQRGFYTTKTFDMWLLASRLAPDCYISMDTVLAKEGIIATVPKYSISAVRAAKRNKTIKTQLGEIIFHSIDQSLIFGITTTNRGINVATAEKAYLDLLYFYQKGKRFVIDPLKEINTSKLNKKVIKKYLTRYRNPKFVAFVKGLIYEK